MRRSVLPLVTVLASLACQDSSAPGFQLVQPPCAAPAPLLGKADPRAPAYIVVFKDGVVARQETNRLAREYAFAPIHIYEFALRGFSAELSSLVVASLRCEASVSYIEHDGVVSIDE